MACSKKKSYLAFNSGSAIFFFVCITAYLKASWLKTIKNMPTVKQTF